MNDTFVVDLFDEVCSLKFEFLLRYFKIFDKVLVSLLQIERLLEYLFALIRALHINFFKISYLNMFWYNM